MLKRIITSLGVISSAFSAYVVLISESCHQNMVEMVSSNSIITFICCNAAYIISAILLSVSILFASKKLSFQRFYYSILLLNTISFLTIFLFERLDSHIIIKLIVTILSHAPIFAYLLLPIVIVLILIKKYINLYYINNKLIKKNNNIFFDISNFLRENHIIYISNLSPPSLLLN